jgi:cyclo(L-tyrosyl-L-tyrosyl) synthase
MEIVKDLKGKAYEKGYEILNSRGIALVPLCPGNGHFNYNNIKDLLKTSITAFEKIIIFIPDKPTEYTYHAMGYPDNRAKFKARKQGNNLRNNANKCLNENTNLKKPLFLNLEKEISSNTHFKEELKKIQLLFNSNEKFRDTVSKETEKVIKLRLKPGQKLTEGISKGVPYVLEELAWLSVCHKILNVPQIVYVYHNCWFLDKFIEGEYDEIPKNHLGFLVIN